MQWAKSVFINFLALIRNRGEGVRQSEKSYNQVEGNIQRRVNA